MKTDDIDNEVDRDEESKEKDLPPEDTMDISDYDVEVSEEDFFGELDNDIDSYYSSLHKKK